MDIVLGLIAVFVVCAVLSRKSTLRYVIRNRSRRNHRRF